MLSSSTRSTPASSDRPRARRGISTSTSTVTPSGAFRERPPRRLADAAGGADVVLLHEDRVVQPGPVGGAAARHDRRLLERAQARRGLARVEDAGARARHRLDVARGERGHAATGGRGSSAPPARRRGSSAAGPSIASDSSPGSTPSPSPARGSRRSAGSTCSKTARATAIPARPARAPLRDRRRGAGVALGHHGAVVRSPAPRSSASARATSSSHQTADSTS